ncbi:uncharacterized protein [Eurosta solidaginis]|uniref:uncharacterized protein n=1 Tax=Eurosta solidaginis TaxID=178769 RepID=UPI003531286B
MFLNNFGEPVAVEDFESQKLDHLAPLLIADPNVTVSNIPGNWGGKIYTTISIMKEISRIQSNMNKYIEEKRVVELKENKSTEVCLADNARIFITPFAWTKGKCEPKLIVLIKDIYLSRVCVDVLSNMLNPVILNTNLRKAIQDGIDIVYFNDSFVKGMNPRDNKVQLYWSKLHLLIYLIRPKILRGLYDTTPPKYITQCCTRPDDVLSV